MNLKMPSAVAPGIFRFMQFYSCNISLTIHINYRGTVVIARLQANLFRAITILLYIIAVI